MKGFFNSFAKIFLGGLLGVAGLALILMVLSAASKLGLEMPLLAVAVFCILAYLFTKIK